MLATFTIANWQAVFSNTVLAFNATVQLGGSVTLPYIANYVTSVV
jgi:hypothetical protein